jgi:arylsulfatase A-like enzyme
MKHNQLTNLGLSFCLTAGTISVAGAQTPKPNVLYIIMDDMNDWANYLGGNIQAKTPNLDRLAARGVSFTNAYTAVPLCNPSRTAMMTGMQPYKTGVYNNMQPISNAPVANNSLMMPQHFRNNGYVTLAAGKVFHTKPTPEVMGKMWDDMQQIDGGYGPFPKNSKLPPELQERWQNMEEWIGPDTDFPDVRNSQKVIDFIGEKHNNPFFVAMGFYRPHTPWTAPKRYFDRYDINEIKRPETIPNDLNDIPAYAIDHFIGSRQMEKQGSLSKNGNYWEQMIRAYLACVSFADDRVGMILDALDHSPYADNTWIVLVGDNGFHHGEKERWGKSALWREACHVPLIIVPPKKDKRVTPGKCTPAVCSIDIYPTLIEACNLPPVENQLAGNSLMPLLKNTSATWNKPCISTFLPGNFVIHSGPWNFIQYADGSRELYNVKNDENEFINLAKTPEYKAITDSLSSFLPRSWNQGVQQTTDAEESLPNKAKINKKKNRIRKK